MAKLEEHKKEIVRLFASGMSKSEIAKRFQVSHTAISKILNNEKSFNESEKVSKQDNKKLANTIIDKAMMQALKNIDKVSPLDCIRIVERLSILWGNNDNEKSKLELVVESLNHITDAVSNKNFNYEQLKDFVNNLKPLSDEHKSLSAKQIKVLNNATKRWNILYGATRSGKTHISYYLALKHIFEHYNENILFVGKTLNTIDRNVFDKMRELFGDENISAIIDKKEINIYGKRCYVVGANDERAITKIQGSGLGYAYLDELTTYPENFFQMLKSRLDEHEACCDATCNPESPSHFVKKHIDKTKDKWIYSEHFTIYDNPFLDKDFVSALEDEYRGTIYFDKWILGKWVKAEGLVFPLFKRERHHISLLEHNKRYGRHSIVRVIYGTDGANTNDSTAIVPLAILDNGMAVTLPMFYHNPKENGQLSNEELMPYIEQYLKELNQNYRLVETGVEQHFAVDCAAADLCLTLGNHLANKGYDVWKYTKKDLNQTTDVVNNAFARNILFVLDYGGYYNYHRKRFIEGTSQLVIDLELMVWDEKNEKFDDTVPNDCADAFRYAVNTYFNNPNNIWETPNPELRFKENEDE